jgi:hypothetical protein
VVTVSIRRYRVLEHSTSEGFRDYVLTTLAQKERIRVTATLVRDELSLRRDKSRKQKVQHQVFTFRVLVLHDTNPDDFSIEVEDVNTKKWSHIVAKGDEIIFSVVN